VGEQNYHSHAHRPTLTAVAALFTLIGIGFLAVFAVRQPSWVAYGLLSLALGVLTLVLISRAYTIRLQDRIIRLEMHGRLARLGRDRDFSRLATPQIVALRFASDGELSALCDRTIAENLSADQIKKGIVNWQPDLHRT
jgi:hypothetical protein